MAKKTSKIVVPNEPSEVTEIRNKILNEFKDLRFEEGPHKYYLNDVELPSVSHVTHKFLVPFDGDSVAERYAEKNGMTKEYWLDQWKFNNLKATTTGSLVHSYGESLGWLRNGHPEKITEDNKCKFIEEKNWLIPTRKKEESILKFYDELNENLHFVLAETKVYTGKNKESTNLRQDYAGTFDLLFYYKDPKCDNNNGLVIMDYKGLPLDTPICTTDGWKTIGTIKEGDLVFDKNGKPTKVLHVSGIHNNPCYKFKFNNGEEIVSDCDHRWEISFAKRKMKNSIISTKYESKVMTTKEIKEYMDGLVKRRSIYIPKIMVSKPIECTEKDLPIDPYVFGCWLGDGHKADGKITNMYKELWDEIIKRGYKIGDDVSQGGSGKAQTRTILGLRTRLREIGCLGNKHIPDIFMLSSYEQRVDLLRGLMDTDGYYNSKRKRFVITTTQEWQAEYSYRLLSTLGIKATKIKSVGTCTNCKNRKFKRTDVVFACDFNPFLIRDVKIETPKNENRLYRNIVSVDEVETVETKCLEVESNTHTFCCGYNMLVTHNTNKELYNSFNRKNGVMMYAPFTNMYSEPFGAYTLQLSAYQLPLEDIGLKVIARRIIHLKDDGTYELIPVKDVTKELREAL